MQNRNDEVKAAFRELLLETSAAVTAGYSVADAISQAPSITKFAKVADDYGVLRVFVGDTFDKPKPLTSMKPEQLGPNLVKFFEGYAVANSGDNAFNEAAFEAFWTASADEILNYSVPITRFVGLVNVDTEGKTHHVTSEMTLRPFQQELDECWMSFVGALPRFLSIRSVLEIRYKVRIDHRGPRFQAPLRPHNLFRIALALQQDAAGGEVFFVDRLHGVRLGGNMLFNDGFNPWGRPLFISSKDAEQIRFYLTRLEEETIGEDSRARRIARACEAYRSAVTRRFDLIGEQFIDSWMVLESLFGEARETTFLLALRIPAFVETDWTKRRDLYAQVRDDYGKRSTYVHGGQISEEDLPSAKTLALARRALLRVLEEPSLYPGAPSQIELGYLETGTLRSTNAPVSN